VEGTLPLEVVFDEEGEEKVSELLDTNLGDMEAFFSTVTFFVLDEVGGEEVEEEEEEEETAFFCLTLEPVEETTLAASFSRAAAASFSRAAASFSLSRLSL
jgi:hypothetical protein